MVTNKVLLKIFGTETYDLTNRDLEIATRVIDWFGGDPAATLHAEQAESKLIKACHYALEQEGECWESVMLNRTRKKRIHDLRCAISLIVWRRVVGTQAHKAELLGGMLARTSVICSINAASEWQQYDPMFRRLYTRISNHIENFLENNKEESE